MTRPRARAIWRLAAALLLAMAGPSAARAGESPVAEERPPVLMVTASNAVIGYEIADGGAVAAWVSGLPLLAGAGAIVDFGLDADWAYVLYESGAVVNAGSGPEPRNAALDVGRAVALAVSKARGEVLVLDEMGGLHAVAGDAPDWLARAPRVDDPVDLALRADGAWILDARGGVHAAGAAPRLRTYPHTQTNPPTRTDPSNAPGALEIQVSHEGRIVVLDRDGHVVELFEEELPRTLLQLRPRADAEPVSMTFDPVTHQPVVLWSDGVASPPTLPSLSAAGDRLRRIQFAPAGEPMPPGFRRETVNLLVEGNDRETDLTGDEILLPIRIRHALDIAWMAFTVDWDPDFWEAAGPAYWWEALPAEADVYAESRTGSIRYEVDCRAAPGSGALNGSGTLLYLPLRPLAPGPGRVAVRDFQWSCRVCRSRVEPADVSETIITIVESPPSVSLAARTVGADGTDGAGSSAGTREDPIPLRPGRPLAVDLVVSGARGLAGFGFAFTFDAERLELISCRPGEWLAREGPLTSRLGDLAELNAGGVGRDLAVTLLGKTRGVRGSGEIVRLEFFPAGPGRGVVRLDAVSAIASDGRPVDLPVRVGEIWTEVR